MQEARAHGSSLRSVVLSLGCAALAGVVGLGSGTVAAWLAPSGKFSWAGIAVVPLWLLLEFFFEVAIGALGSRPAASRLASGIAVIVGFAVAWFAIRGVAP